MSLELVNTFGTLLTVAIIAATAIAAMVQLRHLRASNQSLPCSLSATNSNRRNFETLLHWFAAIWTPHWNIRLTVNTRSL